MLAKKNRADKKSVEKIFKTGQSLHSPSLTFRFILSESSEPPQVSFIVSKSIAKLAVRRNELRRRGYAALSKQMKNLPAGLLGVFVFKKSIGSVAETLEEIKTILNKLPK